MSILKTILIFSLVLAIASARSRQRGRSSHRQRGRAMEVAVADAGATPEADDSNTVLGEAIDDAVEHHAAVVDSKALSAIDAAVAGAELVDNLEEAVKIASEHAQGLEVQTEIVDDKVTDSFDDLETALNLAKKHQKKFTKLGAPMTPAEIVENQSKLLKYLELALHYSVQHAVYLKRQGKFD